MLQKTAKRVDRAARLLLEGCSASSVVAQLSESEGISTRQARRIVKVAYQQLAADVSEIDRRELTAQTVHILQMAMKSALASGHASAVAGCAKTLMELIGLGQQHRHP
jgi:hypothetical protein